MPTHDGHTTDHRTTSLARRLVWIFFAISSVITIIIIYLSAVKTTIVIERTTYPVRSTFLAHVGEKGFENSLQGTAALATFEHIATTSDLGQQTTVGEKSHGIIVITNGWSQVQPLQAGTRFVTKDGVLFRSTERVDVPSGGTAEAEIVADANGAQGDIPKDTRLTLPGLWQGLQDTIYAQSKDAFTGGEKKVVILTEEEIEHAKDAALEQLDLKAKEESKKTAGEDTSIYVVRQTILANQADANAGTAATSLTISAKARYLVLSIKNTDLNERLLIELQKNVTDQEEIVSFDLNTFDISISAFEEKEKTAEIKSTIVGNAQLSAQSQMFASSRYTEKTEDELSKLANQEIGVKSLTAHFAPFWATRTPSSASRIKIDIK